MTQLFVKRAYALSKNSDGKRILVDRLWPRGLTKEQAKIDLWIKEIAPSATLRKWFNHDPAKWEAFAERYIKELQQNQVNVSKLLDFIDNQPTTLIFSAKDEQHNNAVVLKKYIEGLMNK